MRGFRVVGSSPTHATKVGVIAKMEKMFPKNLGVVQ
jgi:hypothetical protein